VQVNQLDPIYTEVIHAGEEPARHLGAVSTPIYQSSVFVFPNAEEGAAIHEGEKPGYFYSRLGNPTQAELEGKMAALERGEAALAVASGMAAVTASLLTVARPGDHVVVPEALYATTGALLDQMLAPFGIESSYVDATDAESYLRATRPNTRVYYLESPGNPTLTLIDIPAVVALARERDLLTVMDNTFATPFNQRPLEMGVDLVLHSATKYLGGHGDLMAGVIVGRGDLVERARWHTNKILGGVIAPMTAWLVIRGIKTLALRMERHNSNALAVARYLEQHPKVVQVHYPGLESHPQHELARRQMRGYGGMVAFDVGSVENGRALVDNVKMISLAVSLGDTSSLIQHSASMTHAAVPRERRLRAGVTDGLLRFSVGLERIDDLLEDLERALQKL
jgi:methionine-gamma-lyase